MNEVKKTGNNEVVKVLNPIDATLKQIQELRDGGDLSLPSNYSVANAMKSAKLILENIQNKDKQKALTFCTKISIYNSLMNMAIQGLNPAKNQCYFIMYGKELTLIRSYFGTELVVKRILDNPLTPINTQVVYEGDTLDIMIDDFGMTDIKNHVTSAENIKKAVIVGAYCKIYSKEKELLSCEYMDISDIKKSWEMSKTYKYDNSTHKKYPGEMAKRTVIGRTCKHVVNNANDDCLVGAFNDTTKDEYRNVTPEKVQLDNSKKGALGLKDRIAEASENHQNLEASEPTVNEDVEFPTMADDGEIIEDEQNDGIQF